MGKNPSNIFREIYKEAKRKQDSITSVDGVLKSRTIRMGEEDHCCYVLYPEVIKVFLKEGYPVKKAEKHIEQWLDNDLITMRYADGYRFIGLYEDVM